MLRVFSSIRKNLLAENKLVRYLTYAVGEVLLIMVGIILALQFQNWNEGRKERVIEIKILTSLHEDFKLNLLHIENAFKNYAEMEQRTLTAMGFIGRPSEELRLLDPLTLIPTSYAHAFTEIVDGTLNSVLSSDKLELLEDDSLKRLLTAYPAAIKSFKLREENLEKVVLNVQRPLIEIYVSLTDLLPKDDPRYSKIKSQAIKSDYEGLMTDIRWQNVLAHRYWTTIELSEAAVELKQKSLEILDRVNQDLRRFNVHP